MEKKKEIALFPNEDFTKRPVKKLKEGQLYELYYTSFLGIKKHMIAYLVEIDVDGYLHFGKQKNYGPIQLNQKEITEIRELKEKGEALKLRAHG